MGNTAWTDKGIVTPGSFHRPSLYADYDAGRFALLQSVREEQQDGCVKDWADRDVLEEEYGIDRYEAWYRDEYFENHFVISLEKLSLMLPPDFIENPKSYN